MRSHFLFIWHKLIFFVLVLVSSCNGAQNFPTLPPLNEIPEVPALPNPDISGQKYHVACEGGDDSLDGMTPITAWQTLARANQAELLPGDALYLKRGCSFVGYLELRWHGTEDRSILIGVYGEGEKPVLSDFGPDDAVVSVTGSYLTVENLDLRSSVPKVDCPVGWYAGFSLLGASHITLRFNEISGFAAGVSVDKDSHRNTILANKLLNNNVLSVNTPGGDDDSGAWGVLLNGDYNEVAYNYFSGNISMCSYDFGQDGGSVEIFAGSHNLVHHNVAINDAMFSEMGTDGKPAVGNIIAYNLILNDKHETANFVIVRGGGKLGPTPETKVINNTVYLTGRNSIAVSCLYCSATVLTLKNNILWADWQPLFSDGPFIEQANILWARSGQPHINMAGSQLHQSSRIVNPRFSSISESDFRPMFGSAAINAGVLDIIHLDLLFDLQGTPIPQGNTIDIGAFENWVSAQGGR